MSLGNIHLGEIIRLYTEEELSLAEVGRRFGVSRQAIYVVLTDACIPLRSKREAKGVIRERDISAALEAKSEAIRAALIAGRSISAVADDLGVIPAAVQRVYGEIDA